MQVLEWETRTESSEGEISEWCMPATVYYSAFGWRMSFKLVAASCIVTAGARLLHSPQRLASVSQQPRHHREQCDQIGRPHAAKRAGRGEA